MAKTVEKLGNLNSGHRSSGILFGNQSKQHYRSVEISTHRCNLSTAGDGIPPEVIVRAPFQNVYDFRNLLALTATNDGLEERNREIGL